MNLRQHLAIRVTAISLALAVGGAALLDHSPARSIAAAPADVAIPLAPGEPDIARLATLFADWSAGATARGPGDVPELLGIAGRLPDDAEALVRGADGKVSTLAVGETASGWKLVAVDVDRAAFERDGRREVRLIKGAQ